MLKLLLVCVVVACSVSSGSADSLDDMFSSYDSNQHYAECQIFSRKYTKWWLHAEKYAQQSRRNVTLGRFAVFSDKVKNKDFH